MKTKKLAHFLNTLLETNLYQDYCPNGLQVESNPDTHIVILGVSACLALFQKAKKAKAQSIIVHHGLFWEKQSLALTGILANRVQFLFQNKINLFAYHLPLDGHPEWGNNVNIARMLGLNELEWFASHGKKEIGIMGKLSIPLSLSFIEKKCLHFFGQINTTYAFGKKKIKTIAMVSGGAASDCLEAYEKGADLFITGENAEPLQEFCREAKMNFISAGHYSSEKSGIQTLGLKITKELGIPCQFISIPNPT